MNIEGFVQSTLHIYPRNMLSMEGAAETVTTDAFEYWVEDFLLPVLGYYSHGDPNSIVVWNNASTHCSQHVLQIIRNKETYVLFTVPY